MPCAPRSSAARVSSVPLRRNRDFLLLQAGQLLSTAGTQTTSIAYPLLVLAATHSPAKAGVVGFVRVIGFPLFGTLSGVAADRWNRRRLMIAADTARAVAVATLAVALLFHHFLFWQVVAVAFVEGAGATLFYAAEGGALRAVVPPRQLPAAVATETGRQSAVMLVGAPLGGALFGLARTIPFLFDAVSYAASTVSVLLMRTPFQQRREGDSSKLWAQAAEGFRFLWKHRFLRTCVLLFGLGNFIFPGVLLVIVVAAKRHGLSGGEIGALTAVFGGGLLLGSLLSPLSRKAFSVRTIMLLELWTWTGSALFLVWPNVYVLTASTLPSALTIPSTDSVVHAYRIAMTPDRLVGRVNGAARNISLLVSPLGPLLAGFLLNALSMRETVAVFTACGVLLAVWGTLSPAIKNAPSLAEFEELPVPEVYPAAPA